MKKRVLPVLVGLILTLTCFASLAAIAPQGGSRAAQASITSL